MSLAHKLVADHGDVQFSHEARRQLAVQIGVVTSRVSSTQEFERQRPVVLSRPARELFNAKAAKSLAKDAKRLCLASFAMSLASSALNNSRWND
jgi:hypothetical protein